jgi:hypothetical protein
MRSILILAIVLLFSQSRSENYLLNGGQESQIRYKMEQKVTTLPGISQLVLVYVIPESFKSPSYIQKIQNAELKFSVAPTNQVKSTDNRGNKITTVTWNEPKQVINATLSFTANNSTLLEELETTTSFPLPTLPADVQVYLQPTKMVPSNMAAIVQKAKQLTAKSQTEFDAVQRILTFIVDYLTYVLVPDDVGAVWAIKNKKGNCQNYSHLAAAFMRAVGIPVRIVNGVTLKEGYDVEMQEGVLTMRMAQGRHSWIEVYFPDLGWVPFDPQQMQLFVSNRFIRSEVGLDNDETINDGAIRWTRLKSAQGQPKFQETFEAVFVSDKVDLLAERQNYGPKKMLLSPHVDAFFSKPTIALSAAPQPMSTQEMSTLSYNTPFEFGNLDFPHQVDFLETRGPALQDTDGSMSMRKNFMVETAEYVTTQGWQYSQTFILKKPVQLDHVGLALHKFGGDGQIWVELYKDDGNGKPGEYLATSAMLSVPDMKFTPGYDWVDFDFVKDKLTLSPGRYWLALGFTGSPIINWFFSYGKTVGPIDGTRYKTVLDDTWGKYLAYEFNYRIDGMTVQ